MSKSRRLAGSIADRTGVDWQELDAAGLADDERRLLEQLRVIASVSSEPRLRRSHWAAVVAGSTWVVFVVMAALAAAKAVLGFASVIVYASSSAPSQPWPLILSVGLYCSCGVLLFAGGASDSRAQALATLFLFVAAAFADPLIRADGGGVLDTIAVWLRAAPPEAFFAAAFWHFARVFPSESTRLRQRRLGDTAVTATIVVGIVLVAANVTLTLSGAALPLSGAIASLDRHLPTSAFWPLLLLLSAPAVPYLLAKARFEFAGEKRRVLWFVWALIFGLGPIVLIAGLTPVLPALQDPRWRPVIGLFLYGALLSLIPATIYAVQVQRVLRWQLILKRTWQYSIVRGTVWVAAISSVIYETARPGGPAGQLWNALSFLPLAGLVVAMFRQQLLTLIDRWFSRDQVDSTDILARLVRRLDDVQHPREMLGVLTQEIDRAVRPANITAFARGPEDARWLSLGRDLPPLDGQSGLVFLLTSMRRPVELDDLDGDTAKLLRPGDRDWADRNHVHLFWPLFQTSGTLIAIVAIGESRSGMPYLDRDRSLIAALASHTSLRMENFFLRSRTASAEGSSDEAALDARDERAWYCRACRRVTAAAAERCVCGAAMQPAAVPLVVNGKFRLERFIGAGGSAIVYEAVDLMLHRRVAIKMLPAVGRAAAERIRREARAMALVAHANLVIVFGVESWRDTPLLVVEYLPNGTLADRLSHGALGMDETIALGERLAEALIKLHAAGLLHRDIKPSNIGYTAEGVPKLLDFGLAGLLQDLTEASPGEDPTPAREDVASQSSNDLLVLGGARPRVIAGTPLYLSPEALRGDAPSPSFDLWSLSLALYQAIAGTLPLDGLEVQEVVRRIPGAVTPDLRHYRPDCPAAVAAFFADALALDEGRRPQTAALWHQRFRALRGGG